MGRARTAQTVGPKWPSLGAVLTSRPPTAAQIMENLRHVAPAPSVAFHERAPDTLRPSDLQVRE